MLSVLDENFQLDASQKRVSEYVGRLFAEGDFADVVAISQKELESHPLNLDLVVYRACAILVLQVSGTVRKNEALVEQAIEHLTMIGDLVSRIAESYDGSLDFYAALGYLVLEKFDKADQLVSFISPQIEQEPDTRAYYDSRKDYWKSRAPVAPKRHNILGEFLS